MLLFNGNERKKTHANLDETKQEGVSGGGGGGAGAGGGGGAEVVVVIDALKDTMGVNVKKLLSLLIGGGGGKDESGEEEREGVTKG